MGRLSLPLGRFDAVHITNPPDLLFIVALAHRLRGARIVFDHHDLVPRALPLARSTVAADLVYRILMLLERSTFRAAGMVISTNESYREVALSRGPEAAGRPWSWFATARRASVSRPRARPGAAARQAPPALYVGVMGPQDGVDYAVRALALSAATSSAATTGTRSSWAAARRATEAMRLSASLGLDGLVEVHRARAEEDLVRHLASADVCLAPDPPSPLNDVSTMTKVMEYMTMGRPMVSFDLPETRVSAADAALYARDEAEFARLIARLLDDPAEREPDGRDGARADRGRALVGALAADSRGGLPQPAGRVSAAGRPAGPRRRVGSAPTL